MDDALLQNVKNIALQAGQIILDIYHNPDELVVTQKSDRSPVTIADLKSHEFIQSSLTAISDHDYPVLSEESELPSYEERAQWEYYWLVDPLDGTKEFIERTDEFAVCIALIHRHEAVLGVVYGPVSQTCYYAAQGVGAFISYPLSAPLPLQVSPIHEPLHVTISRRHYSTRMFDYLSSFGDVDVRRMGSALKFGTIAQGNADLYPCFGRTCEWDSAAGQCIVEVAGGTVTDLQGNPLRYNTQESIYNPPFIAACDPDHHWLSHLPASKGDKE